MTPRLARLVRPDLLGFAPYSSARDSFDSARAGDDAVLLDANENALWSLRPGVNRYPDPHQRALRRAIAQLRRVDDRRILVSNGSDEAIDLLIRAFCTPSHDRIMVMPPTYGMYETYAALNGVEVVRVPLTAAFQLDVGAVADAANAQIKLLFIASPNNPTGNCMNADALRTLIESFNGLVVIDEAYIDFCPERSWMSGLTSFDNLVILQTLSKAWGAAGIRVGMLFAHPDVAALLGQIKPPYNVSGLSQSVGVELLSNASHMRETARQLVDYRQELARALDESPLVERVYPSDANFLLVRFRDVRRVRQWLLENDVMVRDRSSLPGCSSCLRITVGSSEENARLLRALRSCEVTV